jgi:hypothetical protein
LVLEGKLSRGLSLNDKLLSQYEKHHGNFLHVESERVAKETENVFAKQQKQIHGKMPVAAVTPTGSRDAASTYTP